MNEPFTYRQPSRRPVVWAMMAAFGVMFALLAISGAPSAFYLPSALGAVMVLFMLVKNPINGLAIEDGHLVLSAWRRPQAIPLKEIASVQLVEWSDSTDMTVHLNSGAVIEASSGDIPPREAFARVLLQSGIPLEVR